MYSDLYSHLCCIYLFKYLSVINTVYLPPCFKQSYSTLANSIPLPELLRIINNACHIYLFAHNICYLLPKISLLKKKINKLAWHSYNNNVRSNGKQGWWNCSVLMSIQPYWLVNYQGLLTGYKISKNQLFNLNVIKKTV